MGGNIRYVIGTVRYGTRMEWYSITETYNYWLKT